MTFVLTAMAALTRLERLSGEPWAVPA